MKLVALIMAFTLAFTGCTFADGENQHGLRCVEGVTVRQFRHGRCSPAGFFSAKPLARIQDIDSGYDIKAHKPALCIMTSQKLWLGHEYIIAVRKSLWDSLSNDDIQAFTRAAEKSYALLGAGMEDSFARQIEALKSDGAEVRLMNDDEVFCWERATDYRNVQEKWIKQQDIDGLADVLEEIRRCLAK